MSSTSRNAAVLRRMNEFGIMNHLCASLLASVGQAIRCSDIAVLKRSKYIDRTTNHQIAAFLVFKYLQQHNLDATMRCILDESDQQISGDAPRDFADQTLSAFLDDWLPTHAQTVASNLADLRSRVGARMAAFGEKGSEEEEEEEERNATVRPTEDESADDLRGSIFRPPGDLGRIPRPSGRPHPTVARRFAPLGPDGFDEQDLIE